jgi:translation initiation factor 1
MKPRPSTGGLVYSTDAGRMCPACRNPVARCACRAAASQPRPSDGVVRVWRETKGRGGKAVTVVRGLALEPAALDELARQLRAACGSGGTVKDGEVLVQGDHRDKILALLAARGHKARAAGG